MSVGILFFSGTSLQIQVKDIFMVVYSCLVLCVPNIKPGMIRLLDCLCLFFLLVLLALFDMQKETKSVR